MQNSQNGIVRGKDHNKYRKEKPWDSDDIDHWKIEGWKSEYMRGPMLEESAFATLFPKYRESYLRENWSAITKILKQEGIACELNLLEGSMTVKTTRKTSDPYIIIKARDFIKLLARSIPLEQARKILQDGMHCDIIKIGGLLRNKERFVKRRQRIIGPGGQTLKAIELLTNCYVYIQGNTEVSAMGSIHGLKQVRKIILECIQNNYHPIYNIKTLMIKRELARDPELAKEDWSRFLPKFKNRKTKKFEKEVQTIMKKKHKSKKAYTPFPPPQQPSKLDLQLETGEYFLSEGHKLKKKRLSETATSSTNSKKRRERRMKEFLPPKETQPARQTSKNGEVSNLVQKLQEKARRK